jgi:hypothetical protein
VGDDDIAYGRAVQKGFVTEIMALVVGDDDAEVGVARCRCAELTLQEMGSFLAVL